MGQRRLDDDAALLAEVGAALTEREPVPDGFVEAGVAAFAWRTAGAEFTVLELLFDSEDAPQLATSLRSGGSARMLAFAAGSVGIDVEVSAAGVVGQLDPPAPGRAAWQTPAGAGAAAPVDADGTFVLAPPPAGPVRLSLRTAEHTVLTSWVCLR